MPGTGTGHHHPVGGGQARRQRAGEDVDGILGLGARRAEHRELADVAVGPEDAEGLGHLGQRSLGDLQVADGRALARHVPERADHGVELARLRGRERVPLEQRLERVEPRRCFGFGVGVECGASSVARRGAPASAYSVERCTSGRPSGATMASSSSTPIRCPCCAPAAREMFSSISVPPRSLAPARRSCRAPAAPILTQLTWMLSMSPA